MKTDKVFSALYEDDRGVSSVMLSVYFFQSAFRQLETLVARASEAFIDALKASGDQESILRRR